ncbi:MAG TPA: hypothetical protein VGE05_05775 [Novosphingobium sp.]
MVGTGWDAGTDAGEAGGAGCIGRFGKAAGALGSGPIVDSSGSIASASGVGFARRSSRNALPASRRKRRTPPAIQDQCGSLSAVAAEEVGIAFPSGEPAGCGRGGAPIEGSGFGGLDAMDPAPCFSSSRDDLAGAREVGENVGAGDRVICGAGGATGCGGAGVGEGPGVREVATGFSGSTGPETDGAAVRGAAGSW